MTTGEAIPGSVNIMNAYEMDNVGYAEVSVNGWDEVKRLPAGLSIEGRVYGYSGWNSDRNVAYFRTDKIIGHAVRLKGIKGGKR